MSSVVGLGRSTEVEIDLTLVRLEIGSEDIDIPAQGLCLERLDAGYLDA
jgi:hypothetical protein